MNSRLETVVRRLFSDADFRKAATEDAGTTLGKLDLSDAERRSVSRLCQSLATAGGPSLPQSEAPLAWL